MSTLECTVRMLRELAKTAEEGYTGIAAYECDQRDTERAEFLVRVCNDTVARITAEARGE